jgi:flagellin
MVNVNALSSLLTPTQAPTAAQPRTVTDKDGARQAPAPGVAIDPRIEHREDVRLVREDVAEARAGLDWAIGIVREARGALVEARNAAQRAADPNAPDAARVAHDVTFRAALQQLGLAVDTAISAGAPLLSGDSLSVDADPDSDAGHQIGGLDIRLKNAVTGDEALLLTRGASAADRTGAEEAARAADRSLVRFDAGLRRLEGESARLDQHERLLGALDTALAQNVAPDLDAEAARLMALQVRQDLAGANLSVTNARPNALLALFRE